jgi:hypothetical protein
MGSDHLTCPSTFTSNIDSIHMTEVYEFSQSLIGNLGVAACLPHFQSLKLVYAWLLVDYGYLDHAKAYCDAIEENVKNYSKGSIYFHKTFIDALRDLSERITTSQSSVSVGTKENSGWFSSVSKFDSFRGVIDRGIKGIMNGAIGEDIDGSGSTNFNTISSKIEPTTQSNLNPTANIYQSTEFATTATNSYEFQSNSYTGTFMLASEINNSTSLNTVDANCATYDGSFYDNNNSNQHDNQTTENYGYASNINQYDGYNQSDDQYDQNQYQNYGHFENSTQQAPNENDSQNPVNSSYNQSHVNYQSISYQDDQSNSIPFGSHSNEEWAPQPAGFDDSWNRVASTNNSDTLNSFHQPQLVENVPNGDSQAPNGNSSFNTYQNNTFYPNNQFITNSHKVENSISNSYGENHDKWNHVSQNKSEINNDDAAANNFLDGKSSSDDSQLSGHIPEPTPLKPKETSAFAPPPSQPQRRDELTSPDSTLAKHDTYSRPEDDDDDGFSNNSLRKSKVKNTETSSESLKEKDSSSQSSTDKGIFIFWVVRNLTNTIDYSLEKQ